MTRLRCPIPGCNYEDGWAERVAEHASRPHTRCTCGGVFVSIPKHLAQRRVRGLPPCPEAE